MTQDKLYAQWLATGNKYTADAALLKQVYDMLVAAYTEDNRYYHSMQHVQTLLQDADEEYGDAMPDAVFFAIWFHDAVYSSANNDNEKQSAKLAMKYLAEIQLPVTTINTVVDMILKTANHLEAVAEHKETAFFLDADLKILGADIESYEAYKQAVRKEYRIYPDMIYNMGRRKFVQKALSAARIFKTEKFYNLYENPARINLQNELNQLS